MIKKKILSAMVTGLFLLTMTGIAQATLTTIGTASYDDGTGSQNYNLIWDDDNNGNSVIWLDYTHLIADWSNMGTWASGLDSNLTYNIDSAYSVTWVDIDWRLPSAGSNPEVGFEQTTSEMGDLFYNDLGLSKQSSTTTAQLNSSNFDNLLASQYWTGTDYELFEPDRIAWYFCMDNGYQTSTYKFGTEHGLAVRIGQVSSVPVPGAIWLLGSGLAGVFALGRRRKWNCV